jgi:hypothetical protein
MTNDVPLTGLSTIDDKSGSLDLNIATITQNAEDVIGI